MTAKITIQVQNQTSGKSQSSTSLQPRQSAVRNAHQNCSVDSGDANCRNDWRAILSSAGLVKSEPKSEGADNKTSNGTTEELGKPLRDRILRPIGRPSLPGPDLRVAVSRESSLHVLRAIFGPLNDLSMKVSTEVPAEDIGPVGTAVGGEVQSMRAKAEVNGLGDTKTLSRREKPHSDHSRKPSTVQLSFPNLTGDTSLAAISAHLERLDSLKRSSSTSCMNAQLTEFNEFHANVLPLSASPSKGAGGMATARTPEPNQPSTPGQVMSIPAGQASSKSMEGSETVMDPLGATIPAKFDTWLTKEVAQSPHSLQAHASSIPNSAQTGKVTAPIDEHLSVFDNAHPHSAMQSANAALGDAGASTNERGKERSPQQGPTFGLNASPDAPTRVHTASLVGSDVPQAAAFATTPAPSITHTLRSSDGTTIPGENGLQFNSSASVAREAFSALDAGTATAVNSVWVHAGVHHAEAGFQDPDLGWVGVRAQSSVNGVHATLVPSSIEAAQSLGSHLAGLNSYLAQHHTPAEPVTMSVPEHRADFQQWNHGAGQGNGQGPEQGTGHEGHSGAKSESYPSTTSGSTNHSAGIESELVGAQRIVSSESRYISVIA